jgi:acyl-CoA thioesterase-2
MTNPLSQLLPVPIATAEVGQFTCQALRPWCTWNGLHGGALMGMLINGMEQLTGKPAVSATAQFIKGVKEGDEVEFKAEVIAASASITQARISATAGGHLVIGALGTFGAVASATSSGRTFPRVKSPAESPPRTFLRAPLEGDVAETMEVRIAETGPAGACLWVRCPAGVGSPLSAALLSAIADHPPFGLRLALGGDWYGISLDASLRMVVAPEQFDAGDWVLVDIGYDSIAAPFAFATTCLWTADGTLLAVSPQTMRIRNGTASPKA